MNSIYRRWTTAAMATGLALAWGACKKAETPAASAGAGAAGATSATASATPAPTAAAAAAAAGATAKTVPAAVTKVVGRWVRSDGGYVLELQNPDLSGKIEAKYLNPKPINVSRAIWMQGGPGLQVAVELNDTGYPGATYLLTHDTTGDRLVGQYTQPQMQQTFDVEFFRQKASPLR